MLTKHGGWHRFCGTNLVIVACTAAPAAWLSPRVLISAQKAYSMCRYYIMLGNYLWELPLNEFHIIYLNYLPGIYWSHLHVRPATYKLSAICTLLVRIQSRWTSAVSPWFPVMPFEALVSLFSRPVQDVATHASVSQSCSLVSSQTHLLGGCALGIWLADFLVVWAVMRAPSDSGKCLSPVLHKQTLCCWIGNKGCL